MAVRGWRAERTSRNVYEAPQLNSGAVRQRPRPMTSALHATMLIVLLVGAFSPCVAWSQTRARWFVGGEAGRYKIHVGGISSGAPAGVAIALNGGRRWGPVALQLTLTQALGDDMFTALEPGLQVQLPRSTPLSLLAGAGAGLMWEHAGTLSLPYYVHVGLGVQLRARTSVRALVRRGWHANTGDAGTFRGPHMITVGVMRAL